MSLAYPKFLWISFIQKGNSNIPDKTVDAGLLKKVAI